MKKQITVYLAYIESFFSEEHTAEEYAEERRLLLQRIELYQHERLIHLMVTLGFAIFFLIALSLFLIVGGTGLLVLTGLFLVLLVPYISHYYFLENSVQKLYIYYYRLER